MINTLSQKQIITKNVEETKALASKIASYLLPGDIVSLSGELGSGKTTFIQGAVKALGFNGYVSSPSFVLINQYPARINIYHLDLYRMKHQEELEDLGWEELLDETSIIFIEWGEKIDSFLPKNYLKIKIDRTQKEKERIFTIISPNDKFKDLMEIL